MFERASLGPRLDVVVVGTSLVLRSVSRSDSRDIVSVFLLLDEKESDIRVSRLLRASAGAARSNPSRWTEESRLAVFRHVSLFSSFRDGLKSNTAHDGRVRSLCLIEIDVVFLHVLRTRRRWPRFRAVSSVTPVSR